MTGVLGVEIPVKRLAARRQACRGISKPAKPKPLSQSSTKISLDKTSLQRDAAVSNPYYLLSRGLVEKHHSFLGSRAANAEQVAPCPVSGERVQSVQTKHHITTSAGFSVDTSCPDKLHMCKSLVSEDVGILMEPYATAGDIVSGFDSSVPNKNGQGVSPLEENSFLDIAWDKF